ncbi:HXXEE domain-containing protein [Paenibacillus sp. HN-1]|uniref:HXXEE domain-containing protein n=1 Tax=Paenibacillus TaxID=44249 RepID=UPI001CA91ECA|nr:MULTISPECIES: HXXEE domain-containing protein [Paenibacillus]MBY9078388.1 HXXEE domain-containing protein [Paenibacillus sp. CGMCC 1.18879]MBY9087897.1 HXXEE domain-containing protein [Paenibacillus sinensis]
MLHGLDSAVDWSSLLWLFPVLFMFHDFEEILTVEEWADRNRDKVLGTLPPFARKALYASLFCGTRRFALDVLYVYGFIVAFTGMAAFFSFYLPFLAALSLFFLHAFTHVFQAIYLKMYTPGVTTSILIVLPYSVYAFYRLISSGMAGWGDIGGSLLLLLLAGPPLFVLLLRGRAKSYRDITG